MLISPSSPSAQQSVPNYSVSATGFTPPAHHPRFCKKWVMENYAGRFRFTEVRARLNMLLSGIELSGVARTTGFVARVI